MVDHITYPPCEPYNFSLKREIGILGSFIAELHKGSVETPFQVSRIEMRNGAHKQTKFLPFLLSIISSYLHLQTRKHLRQIWTPFPTPWQRIWMLPCVVILRLGRLKIPWNRWHQDLTKCHHSSIRISGVWSVAMLSLPFCTTWIWVHYPPPKPYIHHLNSQDKKPEKSNWVQTH